MIAGLLGLGTSCERPGDFFPGFLPSDDFTFVFSPFLTRVFFTIDLYFSLGGRELGLGARELWDHLCVPATAWDVAAEAEGLVAWDVVAVAEKVPLDERVALMFPWYTERRDC